MLTRSGCAVKPGDFHVTLSAREEAVSHADGYAAVYAQNSKGRYPKGTRFWHYPATVEKMRGNTTSGT